MSKGLRYLLTPSFGTRETLHMCRKIPCGSKIKGQLQAIMSLAPPRSLHFETHLDWEVYAHPREAPRLGQVWKKKSDNWPGGRQRPRRADLYKWPNGLLLCSSSLGSVPVCLFQCEPFRGRAGLECWRWVFFVRGPQASADHARHPGLNPGDSSHFLTVPISPPISHLRNLKMIIFCSHLCRWIFQN